MAEFLTITRYDTEGNPVLVIDNYRDKAYSAEATIIAPDLAKLKIRNRTEYDLSFWDIIHIPTGLAIARVPNDLIKDVKSSFMAHRWIGGGIGSELENTLVLDDSKTLSWEINCFIRYTIEKDK